MCRHATLDSAAFRDWAEQLREPWRAHRKLWELAFICQALEERDALAERLLEVEAAGHGPFGDLRAEGFHLDKGKRVINFTGRARVIMYAGGAGE